MMSATRRWTGWAFRCLGYLLMAFLVALFAADLISYANENKLKYLIINLGIIVAYFSAKLYQRIANRYIDQLVERLGWRPFSRDLINLACFGVIIGVPLLVTSGIAHLM